MYCVKFGSLLLNHVLMVNRKWWLWANSAKRSSPNSATVSWWEPIMSSSTSWKPGISKYFDFADQLRVFGLLEFWFAMCLVSGSDRVQSARKDADPVSNTSWKRRFFVAIITEASTPWRERRDWHSFLEWRWKVFCHSVFHSVTLGCHRESLPHPWWIWCLYGMVYFLIMPHFVLQLIFALLY